MSDASDRSYPPHPLVGVGGIVYRKRHVLLIRRGHAPGKGEWNIPGGLVEVGETSQEAVAREVHEETGLEVEVRSLVDVVDRIIHDDAGRVQYHYILLDYLCRVSGGTLVPGSDAADARWMSPHQLSEIDLSDPVRKVLKKAATLTHGFEKR